MAEERTSRAVLRQVPNVLSGARLVMAGLFPLSVWPWNALLITAAGLSDFADGYIARRFRLTSWIGGLLDAVADKTFVLVVLITITLRGHLEIWEIALLLSRDLTVAGIVLYVAGRGRWEAFRHMPSRPFGKFTTAILFLLFLIIALRPDMAVLIGLIMWPAIALSLFAAGDYLFVFLRALRRYRDIAAQDDGVPSAHA